MTSLCCGNCYYFRHVEFQIVNVPGTNLFLGVVNQTCSYGQAFCPCNVVRKFLLIPMLRIDIL